MSSVFWWLNRVNTLIPNGHIPKVPRAMLLPNPNPPTLGLRVYDGLGLKVEGLGLLPLLRASGGEHFGRKNLDFLRFRKVDNLK